MTQRFHAGDIILQINWRAYYLVVSANAPDQYDGARYNYQFQLLSTEIKHAAPTETTLYRSRQYIDAVSQSSWQKVA